MNPLEALILKYHADSQSGNSLEESLIERGYLQRTVNNNVAVTVEGLSLLENLSAVTDPPHNSLRNAINTLELFKDVVGRNFFKGKNALQGLNIAIKILRKLEVVNDDTYPFI